MFTFHSGKQQIINQSYVMTYKLLINITFIYYVRLENKQGTSN